MTDGWITHDGGPCPVDPETWVQCDGQWYNWAEHAAPAAKWVWERADRYRVFAPVIHGPSPFVADTAARIMAAIAVHGGSYPTDEKLAEAANRGIRAALALEAALKGAGR